MNTNLLCFCLPTCNVEDMFNHLLPSLKNLGKLKDYCSFGITFQPPYTEEQINQVVKEFTDLGLEFKYEYKEYNFLIGETPLNLMRQDCSMKYPKALFYGILDDDMEFQEGIDLEYLDILYLMLQYKNFSVASLSSCESSEYFKQNDFTIKLGDLNHIALYTKAGLIVRGGVHYGFEGLLPEDMINLIGGRQDASTAIYRVLQGDSILECNNGKCLHYEYRKIPGYDEYAWLNFEDSNTNIQWLSQHDYIRNLNGNGEINFSEKGYAELIDKGCLDYKLLPINLLNQDSYSITELEDLINNISTETNYSLKMNYNKTQLTILDVPQLTPLHNLNIMLIATYIKDDYEYLLIDATYKTTPNRWLKVCKVEEDHPIGVADIILIEDLNLIKTRINNTDLKDLEQNKDQWDIVWNLLNYGKEYLSKFISNEEDI